MENLAQIIQKEIEDNFDHKFLCCKQNLVVEITDKKIKIIDLIDNTDACGADFESQEYFDFEFDFDEWYEEREEYIEQEESNQEEFNKNARHFVCDILNKHLGEVEADKYTIDL